MDIMKWQTIIETPEFLKIVEKFGDREVVDEMIEAIAKNPEIGDIIPRTGGCRKLRWQRNKFGGKRGGFRTIYYYYDCFMPVYLLLSYPKSVKDNIDSEMEQALKTFVKSLVKAHKRER
ncbi:type II toxin-antitoxin system RelE/ParE family toxin [Thiotrichales bacterium 19S9-12]|nr:type II toxin-antitoxin system RelE/ParE family toxin [Thiotrichales bacterium 19S9-11]MCF6812489.1 type II toxin-antitoxin system RelE/ParE family toxin [Thiotrichales bacterium 19S9-12]